MAWRPKLAWLVFLPPAILFLAIYGPVLFARAGTVPATHDSDFFMYYFPMTEMAFEMLRQGIMPLWNPYLFSGMPLLASIEIGILYPPNWLHLVVSSERAFCLLYVMHVVLAGGGTWLYVRGRGRSSEAGLFSAVSFAFAAPTILHFDMGMTSLVYSSAWIPLIFALVDRCLRQKSLASAAWLALALACQFLAGFPMFTLLLAALIPAYLLALGIDWRSLASRANVRLVLLFATAALLALGLILPQLLPTMRYLDNSHRGELVYEQATHCCFPAPNLVTFLVPEFFGNDKTCAYWGETFLFDANAFCGVTTLLLVVISIPFRKSRDYRFWAATVVVVLALALGKYSWFYDVCYLYVPWVDRFRGVSRLVVFALFGVSVLAAFGVDALRAVPATGRRFAVSTFVASCAATILLGAVALRIGQVSPPVAWQSLFDWVRGEGAELYSTFSPESYRQILRDGFATMLLSLSLSAGILLSGSLAILLLQRRSGASRLVAPALLSLLAVELYAFDARYVVLTPTEPWREISRRVTEVLPSDAEFYRVAAFSSDPPLPLNRLLYGRLQGVGGHENFVLSRYSRFLSVWAGIDPAWQTFLSVPNHQGLYDLLNVRYYLAPRGTRPHDPADELVDGGVFRHDNRDFALYRNRDALPRASLIHQALRADDVDDACQLLEHLFRGSVETDSIVEGDPGIELVPLSATEIERENVQIVEYRPGRIVAEVAAAAPGLLLYSGNYYPSWEATVDGRETRVLPANVFMRAVPILPGNHRVELVFRSRGFSRGCVFAAISFAAIGGIFVFSQRPRRHFFQWISPHFSDFLVRIGK